MSSVVKQWFGVAESVLATFSAIFLFAMMALTFLDVICRYFFASSIDGASEIIGFLLGFTIFTALPLVTAREGHIVVGMLDWIVSPRIRPAIRFCEKLITLAVFGMISWVLIQQSLRLQKSGFLTEYLDIPEAYIVYIIAMFSLVTCVTYLQVIWQQFYAMVGPSAAENSAVSE